MDDLINRTAAIVELDKYAATLNPDKDNKELWKVNSIKQFIKQFPSAQPEHECETCRYNSKEWNEEPCDSCTMGGSTNHWKPQPQWIPCSERQPTEDGEYITTVEDGEGMFVTSNDWRQDWKEWGFLSYYGESDDPAWRRVTNVVAWKELPEPYKNKEGQG